MADGPVLGTLGDLAAVPGMPSEPTLRKIIRENPDFPVVSVGSNGVAYEIDVEQAVLWLRKRQEDDREAARARSAQVAQFALDLLGRDAAAAPGEAGLSPVERKQLLEEELVAIKVEERRGQLIRKDSVEEALGSVVVMDRELRKSFAARLSKRIELTRDLIAAIDALNEKDQRDLAARMEKITEIHHADATPGADTPV